MPDLKKLYEEIANNKNWKHIESQDGENACQFLYPKEERLFFVRPLKYPEADLARKKGIAMNWVSGEVDPTNDYDDFITKLSDAERKFILRPLIFFLSADIIVGDNLTNNLIPKIKHPEIIQFWAWQAYNETIHSDTYLKLVETLIRDKDELLKAYYALKTEPAIKAKAEWALKMSNHKFENEKNTSSTKTEVQDVSTQHENSIQEQLVAWACVEGLFFFSSFVGIGWVKHYRGCMHGLSFSNDLISRDEYLHFQFSVYLYSLCKNKLPHWRVQQIVLSALEVEEKYIQWMIPEKIEGMSYELMSQFIRYMADLTLEWFECPKLFNVENPFPWMSTWGMTGSTSFFEKRVSEYRNAHTSLAANSQEETFDMKKFKQELDTIKQNDIEDYEN